MYPVLLIAALLMSDFVAWWIPVTGLIRPLLVLGGLAVVVQLIATRFLGREPGAFVAAVTVMAVLDLRVLAFLAIAATIPTAFATLRAKRAATDWPRLTRFLNVVGAIALASQLVSAGLVAASLPQGLRHEPPPVATTTGTAPDIYLVMLDGYPRPDTLQEVLGLDSAPFLATMGELGFDFAESAHSNYNRTTLTLASMLNATHLDDLMPNPPAGFPSQNRHLITFIHDGAAVRDARALGYTFIDIPSDVSYLAPAADQNLDSGQVTHFEYTVAQNGGIRRFLHDAEADFFRAQHRARIEASFDRLKQLPGEAGQGPRLILAHLMLPHHPLAFRRDGSLATVPGCVWDECEDGITNPLTDVVKAGFAEQVEYTNAMVEDVARTIIEGSARPAVIVFFSDHGFRHWLSARPETFRSLLLTYTPGHADLFPNSASPVTLIPRILNAYLGTSLPLANDDVWYDIDAETGYFPLTRMTQEPP